MVSSIKASASTSASSRRVGLPRLLSLSLGAVGALLGCGGSPDSAKSQTVLTSATAAEEANPKTELIRTEGERDEARHALDQCRDATSRGQSELQIFKERDLVAEKAWSTIDSADNMLRALQLEATRATTVGARQKLESSITEVKDRRTVVERDARKIPANSGPAWARFKGSIEKSIGDLERVIAANAELISGMSP